MIRQSTSILNRSFTPSILLRSKHTLPSLPYAYNALEPSISEEIMTLHHKKHHQTYVNNLNAAEEKLANADVKGQIGLQAAIKFNGGGHINHSLFWENLAPSSEGGGKAPSSGKFIDAVNAKYGSIDGLKEKFNAALASIQGSGWAWLVKKEDGSLDITTTPNQDPITAGTVLIGVDAWEHAYYLQYQNDKVSYFNKIWDVINWKAAEKRFG